MSGRDADEREAIRSRGRSGGIFIWSGAFALLGVALVLGVVLLPACGITVAAPVPTRWFNACPAPPPAGSEDLHREAERAAELRDRIARLERKLAGLPACPPPPVIVEVPPEPAPPEPAPPEPAPPEPPPDSPESEFDRRLDEQGGEVSEELTVTLIWDDDSDLDLQVFCPDGGVAGVAAEGCGGGILDVDANGYESGGLRMMDRPVENVRFGTSALRGIYQIQIRIAASYLTQSGYDRARNLGSHPFRVRVLSRGTEQVFEGVHPGADGANAWFEFTQ